MGIKSQSEGAATNRLLIVDDEPDITRIIEIRPFSELKLVSRESG
jgi:hypothetical protein